MTSLRLVVSSVVVSTGMVSMPTLAAAGSYSTPAINSKAVYVADEGAKCDGSTNDQPAIQRAFDKAKKGGQVVFPPNQTCMVRKTVKMKGGKNWSIIGRGATIKMDAGGSGNWILLTLKNTKFGIYDLNLEGNPKSKGGTHNLGIYQGRYFEIVRTSVTNATDDGIYIAGNSPNPRSKATVSKYGVLFAIRADNNHRNGIQITNGYNISIKNSVISNHTGRWPKTGVNIEANRSFSPSSRNIEITDNFIFGNGGYAVKVSEKGNPTNIIVENNYIGDNRRGGVAVKAKKVSIRNNMFESFTRENSGAYSIDGIISLYKGASNVTSDDNAFESIKVGDALLFVAGRSGSGHTFVGNCIHDVNIDEINDRKNKVRQVNNQFNSRSCPDPN